MSTVSFEPDPVKRSQQRAGTWYPHWCKYHLEYEALYPDRRLPLIPFNRGNIEPLPPERHYLSRGGHALDCGCERCFEGIAPALGLHLLQVETEAKAEVHGMVPELLDKLFRQEGELARLKETVRQVRNYLSSLQPAAPPKKPRQGGHGIAL